MERYRHYAVVLADTNRAQIFVFSAREAVHKDEIENVKTKHSKVGGWSQARYQRYEENYHLQHAKEVVEHLERIVLDEQLNQIILAGDQDVVIPLLREQMSKALSDKVIDTLSLSTDTPEHELLQESLKAFHVNDSLTDMQSVEKFLGEFRGDNLAVAGVPDTLAALSNGQVEELLIASSSQNLKYDEAEVQKVLEAYQTMADVPEVLNERSIADELVRRAHELSSARVTLLRMPQTSSKSAGWGPCCAIESRMTMPRLTIGLMGRPVPKPWFSMHNKGATSCQTKIALRKTTSERTKRIRPCASARTRASKPLRQNIRRRTSRT